MNKSNIIILVCIFSFNANAQEFTFKKSVETEIISLYIDDNKTKMRSNIGVISKRIPINRKRKVSIDTLYFSNYLSKKPERSFQNKVSSEMIKNNIKKYYLVYDKDPYGDYVLPKDSIPLQGYFKMLDEVKPNSDWVNELTIYDEVDYSGTNDNLKLRPVSFEPTSNSEGWFSDGLKNGRWIYNTAIFSKTEEHYKNGVRDGLYTVYDKNDSILYQTQFINGTGIEKIYRSDGSLYHIKHFKNGSINYSKLYALYYDNGEVAEEFNLKEKTRKSFYKNGNISCLQVDTIKNDKSRNIIAQLRTIIIYDRRGVVRERKYYKDYNWVYTIFYNETQRIERVESGNVILYFNKNKLKNIKFKN